MQIAAALPHRKFAAVWARLQRLTHPGNHKGAWTPEEDSKLLEFHGQHGSKWSKIGNMIGRLPEACRDRFRAIGMAPTKNVGHWNKEEEEALSSVIMEYSREVNLV